MNTFITANTHEYMLCELCFQFMQVIMQKLFCCLNERSWWADSELKRVQDAAPSFTAGWRAGDTPRRRLHRSLNLSKCSPLLTTLTCVDPRRSGVIWPATYPPIHSPLVICNGIGSKSKSMFIPRLFPTNNMTNKCNYISSGCKIVLHMNSLY